MIKLFINPNTVAFTGKSSDYITKDAVERANMRLMGVEGAYKVVVEDVYAKHHLPRPTHEQIVEAAANAMRQLAVAK